MESYTDRMMRANRRRSKDPMSNTGSDVRRVEPIWRQWNLIYNFGQRDLKTKFKGSALGWLWSLMVPLATIAIYSVVFSIIFRASPPDMGNGKSGVFVLWLFVGLTTWTFFSSTVNSGMAALLGAGPLLQKVYFPAYAPVIGSTLAAAVQWGIEVGILLVVMLVLVNVGWTWLLIPVLAAIFALFTASLAITVSILNVYYRDLAHLVAIALQLLFYMTPIIYPLAMVPDSWKPGFFPEAWPALNLQSVLAFNPLTQFVELFRSVIYGLEVGSLWLWIGVVLWTLGAVALAVIVSHVKGADLGENV